MAPCMTLKRETSAGYMTHWAARLFARTIDRRLKPLGLSSGQLSVFFALGGGASLTQKALVEVAATEQPTMAATLARMERDGLVRRGPDPEDGRGVLYALAPEALAKVPAVESAVAAVNAAALRMMSAEEVESFLRLLAAAVNGLEESEPRSPSGGAGFQ